MTDAALTVAGVSKSYGGVRALRDVTCTTEPGRVLGIIGPNGAGKSTLFNVLTNVDPADCGEISIFGKPIRGMSPSRVARLGVARTFQTSKVFPHLSVRENILVGAYLGSDRPHALSEIAGVGRSRAFNRKSVLRADELLRAFQLEDWAHRLPDVVPPGAQKQMDLARVLMGSPRLVLLDEPAAGLNERATEDVAEGIAALRRMGMTVLVVEHNMSLLMGVADEVVVLDAGEVICAGPPAKVSADERVRAAYFGSSD